MNCEQGIGGKFIPKDTEKAFWEKVTRSDNCWEWQAGKDKDGYGRFRYRGEKRQAHRVSWELMTGQEPTDCVLHSCDNPSCVKPDHLSIGTTQENTRQMVNRGRHNTRRLDPNKVKRARKLLTNKKITQEKIAKMLNISAGSVSNIKTGKVRGKV